MPVRWAPPCWTASSPCLRSGPTTTTVTSRRAFPRASAWRPRRRGRGRWGHARAHIFANPRAFNEAADFQQSPRNEARDLAICEEEGLHLVFAPPVEEIYP